MALLELEGNTLGEKHYHYNKLVQEAVTNNTIALDPADDFNSGENDVENLMKIDIASEQRNVEYILKVLKCEDMLYVSRALKKCTWLITDQQYAHIINPEYLKSQLFPEMTSKAIYKLMKLIKLNIKDESRAEQFFNYEKDVKRALKWLPSCSIEFIDKQATKYADKLGIKLLKRLCAKSIHVLEIVGKPHEDNYADIMVLKGRRLTATNFLLRFDTSRYLDVVEQQFIFICPDFGKRTTNFLMKTCPERIINHFERYQSNVHLPTIIKYLKNNNIVKDFLFTQAKKEKECYLQQYLERYNTMKSLIEAMPESERIGFVNDVFIHKIQEDDEQIIDESEKKTMKTIYQLATSHTSEYMYYDFSTAFTEITKLIRTEPNPKAKANNLRLLVNCAGQNTENIQKVLEYYHEKHDNESDDLKYEFLSKVISNIRVKNCNQQTWDLLDKIFQSLGAYNNSTETPSYITGFIILYKIMHNETLSEPIENKFRQIMLTKYVDKMSIQHIPAMELPSPKKMKKISQKKNKYRQKDLLKECQTHLDTEGKEQLFAYLLCRAMNEINNNKMNTELEFVKIVGSLIFVLDLLKGWNKQLNDYPWVLDKIKECAKIKKHTYPRTDLSLIYDAKKDWRRLMFEDSALISPSELVFVNMLKHDFRLFTQFKNEVESLCLDKNVLPRLMLNKLRLYWPCSQAVSLTNMYLENLHQIEFHKALIFGICALLPRQQLLDFIHTYAPKEAKMDNVSDVELSIQKELAKQMHIARPIPPSEVVFLFAKGDYLKFILPSLLSILNNASAVQVRKDIMKLLDAPVSLQKHGIPLAQAKLETDDVKKVFAEIWMHTKSATIRTRIFQFTYQLLRNETDPIKAQDTWNLMSTLIDNLTHKENKVIYELLAKEESLNQLPANIKPLYLMKTHTFLNELLPDLTDREKDTYNYRLKALTGRIREFMELLRSDFVVGVLMKHVEEKFLVSKLKTDIWGNVDTGLVPIMTSYVLCVGGDKTREERYQQFFVPLFQRSLATWDRDDFAMKRNIEIYLDGFIGDLRDYVFNKKQSFPLEMYEDIKERLSQLPISENYVMVTKWNLFVELAKLLNSNKLVSWDDMVNKVAPEFGIKCLEMLKTDVKVYFPCIYNLFSSALHQVAKSLINDNAKWIVYRCLLMDVEFVQGYLAILKLYSNRGKEENKTALEVYKMIHEHPSDEVKMFCKHKFVSSSD